MPNSLSLSETRSKRDFASVSYASVFSGVHYFLTSKVTIYLKEKANSNKCYFIA